MWADHSDFMGVVATAWGKKVSGSLGTRFAKKRKHLKHTLKEWNWSGFGNTKEKLVELQNQIQTLETQLQQAWSKGIHNEWDGCKKQLQQVEACEIERLRNQAIMDWMKDGDKNSKFFHAVIKEKRRRNITKILANRLSILLSKLISEEQTGFICFKLDMAKACDHLEWRFLLCTLREFGFSDVARDLIYRLFCNINH